MRLLLLASLLLLLVSNTGCATRTGNAPWDPKDGSNLFDQIPPWDNAAEKICGGHLTEEERRRTGKSPRC